MKDANMKVSEAVKLLFRKSSGKCSQCGRKLKEDEWFDIVTNESKNRNLISDGKIICRKCSRTEDEKA
jgi:hypothetical protein